MKREQTRQLREIIRKRFEQGLTRREIADRLGLPYIWVQREVLIMIKKGVLKENKTND